MVSGNSENLKKILRKTQGPCVVMAGAGTGKTHAIVEKIKYLVENEIYPPEKIVCITFSNEAVKNLTKRIREIDFADNKEPVIKTFHSFSAMILRKYGNLIGIDSNFQIADSDEAKIILHGNLKLSPQKANSYAGEIFRLKDSGKSFVVFEKELNEVLNGMSPDFVKKRIEEIHVNLQNVKEKDERKRIIEEMKALRKKLEIVSFFNSWRAYEKIKEKRNCLDYGDLNLFCLKLLEGFPDVGREFNYFVVDEFQDTNRIQLELLFKIVKNKNITVVGDVNQSIYGFRGAYEKNISFFKDKFCVGEEDVYELGETFRCPNRILNVAHKLISKNYSEGKKCLFVRNFEGRDGEKVKVFEMENELEEARKVSEIVKEELEKGVEPEEICVMFRTHKQGEVIKNFLERNSIESVYVNGKSLLKEKRIRLLLDYLTIVKKISKEESGGSREFWNVIYRNKFSEGDLIKIGKIFKKLEREENFCEKFMGIISELDLSREGKIVLGKIKEIVSSILEISKKNVLEIVKFAYNELGFYDDNEEKGVSVLLNRFYELAQKYSTNNFSELEAFLNYTELLENLEINVQLPVSEKKGVRLMTSHSTKGLEFKTIILTNLAEKRFPLAKRRDKSFTEKKDSVDYESFISEERRLCYVSFTRTKEKLFLTYAKKYGERIFSPSIFLEEFGYKENPDVEFVKDKIIKEKNIWVKDLKKTFVDNSIVNDIKKMSFSPTSLLTFNDCQKRFEYRYVYNMPERKAVSWESMRLGSFVHKVLDKAVRRNFKSFKELFKIARELVLEEEWESINLEEVSPMLQIFLERNKGRYDKNSKTEILLDIKLGGFKLLGYADRIDFSRRGLEIVDYKTGRMIPVGKQRNWQLGYYALAAEKFGNVHKVILDMLRLPSPIEIVIDENRNGINSLTNKRLFNVDEIKKEFLETINEIIECSKSGFHACPVEKGCDFCKEFIYKE